MPDDMTGYEAAELAQIDSTLSGLSSPSNQDVYRALRPFDERAIASVAAKKAQAGGGGGGSMPVSCLLAVETPLAIRTTTQVPLFWDALYDNTKDFNALAAIPGGLGLSFAFDGSSGDITTTEAGVWSFAYSILREADATWAGSLAVFQLGRSYQLVAVTSDASTVVTDLFALPSGTTIGPLFNTETQATANPYTATVNLVVVRLG